MQKPKCRLCGVLHYPSEPHDFGKVTPDSVRAPKPSKLPDFVTREVPRSEPASRVRAMQAEIEALHGEVSALKRQLAKRVDTTVPRVDTTPVAATGECPTCKARRLTKAKAQQKWRTSTGSKTKKQERSSTSVSHIDLLKG